jgi:hypothetical protein
MLCATADAASANALAAGTQQREPPRTLCYSAYESGRDQ